MKRVIVFEPTQVDQRVAHLLFLIRRHWMLKVYNPQDLLGEPPHVTFCGNPDRCAGRARAMALSESDEVGVLEYDAVFTIRGRADIVTYR
jgi:hypothetical protein